MKTLDVAILLVLGAAVLLSAGVLAWNLYAASAATVFGMAALLLLLFTTKR